MLETFWIPLALLVAGFILLVKGADFFVEGSAAAARMLKVPPLIIGMTIVAMGTSLPECSVSIIASLDGNNSLSVSNVVGSNIFNLMVVCGICALFFPLAVAKDTVKRDLPFSIVCAVILLIFGVTSGGLKRFEGVVLIMVFAIFLVVMIRSALNVRKNGTPETPASAVEDGFKRLKPWMCVLYIVGGIAAIKFGGDFVVDGAVAIARTLRVTETLIGLTIVAIGTSLPELVTSIVAAKKNEVDMAVGNVVGSNIFNILWVLGIAAAISPMDFIAENIIDIVVLIIFSLAVLIAVRVKGVIDRKTGIGMLVLYAAYTAYILAR